MNFLEYFVIIKCNDWISYGDYYSVWYDENCLIFIVLIFISEICVFFGMEIELLGNKWNYKYFRKDCIKCDRNKNFVFCVKFLVNNYGLYYFYVMIDCYECYGYY